MILNSVEFIEHRKKQESSLLNDKKFNSPFDSVFSVEINITELCNRKCVFCPRVDPDVYPNRKLFIQEKTIDRIINELIRLDYKGKVSFSGFGEPLLNKNFCNILKKFRDNLPNIFLETNTNGDFLTSKKLKELFNSGLNKLYWNLYDGPEQIEFSKEIIKQSEIDPSLILFRPHWKNCDENEWGLILNNRAGSVDIESISILPLKQKCNLPFYKMFIDYNGDILTCCNDWMRKRVIDNVFNNNLDEIWFNESLNSLRLKLSKNDRNIEPCKNCNVDGLFSGESSYMFLMEKINEEIYSEK